MEKCWEDSIEKTNLDGREVGNIFINESLCPLNRKLRGFCNALKKRDKIAKFRSKNGMIQMKIKEDDSFIDVDHKSCLLYTSPSPRDQRGSRMPSSA